jgi:hypothetical protein
VWRMRDRRLQRALDTIALHGGLMGVTSAAKALGVQPANIDWHVEPWDRIDCGRVYLKADVQAAIEKKAQRNA